MKEITVKVYQFNELEDDAKEKARAWYRKGALDHDWWESTYEDAANIGLKIESFDLDRNRHAKGKFTESASDVAEKIVKNHGETCETFKTATKFLADKVEIDKLSEGYEYDDKLKELQDEFLKSLLEDYSILLEKEYEWLLSDEQIDESIIANEYDFTEHGKRFV